MSQKTANPVFNAIKSLFVFGVILVLGSLAFQALRGGGGSGRTGTDRDRGNGYEVLVEYTSIRYVIDIQVTIANHPNPPVKLDATGQYGVKIEGSGVWSQPLIYRSGTGGIIVDVTLATGNPTGATATCEIWRTRNATRTVRVAGPQLADRITPAECRWDRTYP